MASLDVDHAPRDPSYEYSVYWDRKMIFTLNIIVGHALAGSVLLLIWALGG